MPLAVSWPVSKHGEPCRTLRATFLPGAAHDRWHLHLLVSGFRGLATTLLKLHERDVTHRNLSLGGIVVTGSGRFALRVFRIWCDDANVRGQALLERSDNYLDPLKRHGQLDRADAVLRLERFGRQLGFDALTLDDLRELARKAGKRTLLSQLGALDDGNG
ncbi:MAG TPA: hypothetical protein VFQ44_08340 [Streptosporangiaceae bacterium]|nr:hypothetical protein [Streptosporangiaceae bacterium]